MNFFFAGGIFEEWYWEPVFFIVFAGPIIITLSLLSLLIFLKAMGRQTASKKLLLTKFLLFYTVLGILIVVSYSFYLDHRTGLFNPYTDECVAQGHKGARGDYCYD